MDSIIASGVRRQIESDIFVPLMEKLHELLLETIDEEEQCLRDKMAQAHRKPQVEYARTGLYMP